MMSFDAFAKEEFYQTVNHMEQYAHVQSRLISGTPSYKKVSIVIPTYKRAHLLKEALDSCLDQTDDDYNIVIADNVPERDDETEKLIHELNDSRIVYYKNEENIGALGNFNRCIELSDCDYCIFLCSDDLLSKNLVEDIKRLTSKHPDSDMLLPQKAIVYPERTYKMKGYSPLLRLAGQIANRPVAVKITPEDFMVYYAPGGPSGIIYKRSAFMELGGFNPEWHPTGDNILHIYMAHMTNVYLLNIDSGEYRMIENITSESNMLNNFLIQNYLFRVDYVRHFKKFGWVDRFYKGYVFYRLARDNKGYFNKLDVRKHIGYTHFTDFLFNRLVWGIHFVKLPFRIRWW